MYGSLWTFIPVAATSATAIHLFFVQLSQQYVLLFSRGMWDPWALKGKKLSFKCISETIFMILLTTFYKCTQSCAQWPARLNNSCAVRTGDNVLMLCQNSERFYRIYLKAYITFLGIHFIQCIFIPTTCNFSRDMWDPWAVNGKYLIFKCIRETIVMISLTVLFKFTLSQSYAQGPAKLNKSCAVRTGYNVLILRQYSELFYRISLKAHITF